MNKTTVVSMIRALVKDAGSQSAAARRLGVPRQTLHLALRGDIRPVVLKPMGLERVEVFRRVRG